MTFYLGFASSTPQFNNVTNPKHWHSRFGLHDWTVVCLTNLCIININIIIITLNRLP